MSAKSIRVKIDCLQARGKNPGWAEGQRIPAAYRTDSTAPARSPSRMQTMPGKSLATSLKRKRRALKNMYFQTPFACASGLWSQELRSSAVVLKRSSYAPSP